MDNEFMAFSKTTAVSQFRPIRWALDSWLSFFIRLFFSGYGKNYKIRHEIVHVLPCTANEFISVLSLLFANIMYIRKIAPVKL